MWLRISIVLVLIILQETSIAEERLAEKEKTAREQAVTALRGTFDAKSARANEQNDEVCIFLFSRADEMLQRAAKLSEETRKQVRVVFISDPTVSEVALKLLLTFPNISELNISDMQKWQPALEPLMTGLPKLKSVWAQQMDLTNKELAIICKAKGLECLMVDGNKFTRGACKSLIELDELRQLALSGSDINDEDILNLRDKQTLGIIWLGETNVTEKGVEALKSTLSKKCLLNWSPKDEN